MVLEKTVSSGKRFGARYGRRIRHKFSKIEAEQKKGHKCPYCHEPKVRRIAAGIWNCTKCKAKFTGKAYTIPKKVIITEEASKERIVIVEEEKTSKKNEEKPQKYKEAKKDEEDEYVQPELSEEGKKE